MAYSLTTIVGDVTANYGNLYLVDATNNSITVTLPIATGNAGSHLQFKRIDWTSSCTVTIIPNPSDSSKIDGTLTSLVVRPGQSILLFVDSTESWLRTMVDLSHSFMFGDGSDGVVSIVANTTLARDMYYMQLAVGNGAIVNTNGFRIFVLDRLTLTGNGTTIHNNGSSAVNNIGGAGGGGNLPGSLISTIGGGFNGVNGVSGLSLAGLVGLPSVASPTSVGGVGGAGGSIGGFLGGVAGLAVVPTVSAGGAKCIKQLESAIVARDHSGSNLTGGSSGGSGASNSLTGVSGGSGGGGGMVLVAAYSILCDSKQACTISANGGRGGDAKTNNASGGGGGGGGTVILLTRVSNALTNLPGLLVSAIGGAGGNAFGTGSNGSAGTSGIIQIIDRL